jgi:hypothetical protein
MREHGEMVAESIRKVLRIPERAAIERSIPEWMKVQRRGEVTTIIPSRRRRDVGYILIGVAICLVVFALRVTAIGFGLGGVLVIAAAWAFLDTQEVSVSPSGIKSVGKPVSMGRNWEIPAADVLLPTIRKVFGSSYPGVFFEVTHCDRRNETRILAKCEMREQAEYIVETIWETFGLAPEVSEERARA